MDLAPIPSFNDVDEYVSSSESNVPDVWDGAGKVIRWSGVEGDRTEHVVVYVHGFSATRQEVAPFCDSLASRLGANLYYTRLKGHGRPGAAMAQASAGDWLSDVREALAVARAVGRRIVLVGSSTGATLAAWAMSGVLTVEETRDVEALVLLSPNFGPADWRSELLLMPWGQQLARVIIGEYREWEPHNEAQGRYWTTRYPVQALFPMMAIVKAVAAIDAATFDTPVLVAYSPVDAVVSTNLIVDWYDSIASDPKTLVVVPEPGDPSGHILAGDILSPGTTERLVGETVAFLELLEAAGPTG